MALSVLLRPLGKSDFCIGHHEKAQEWRVKGGYASSDANRARNMMPSELRPLANELLETMEGTVTGESDTCHKAAPSQH